MSSRISGFSSSGNWWVSRASSGICGVLFLGPDFGLGVNSGSVYSFFALVMGSSLGQCVLFLALILGSSLGQYVLSLTLVLGSVCSFLALVLASSQSQNFFFCPGRL